MTNKALDEAADALRRYEQSGKKLKGWDHISRYQRSRWVVKAVVVLQAYHRGFSPPHPATATLDDTAKANAA